MNSRFAEITRTLQFEWGVYTVPVDDVLLNELVVLEDEHKELVASERHWNYCVRVRAQSDSAFASRQGDISKEMAFPDKLEGCLRRAKDRFLAS
jgi:hypothetical protein